MEELAWRPSAWTASCRSRSSCAAQLSPAEALRSEKGEGPPCGGPPIPVASDEVVEALPACSHRMIPSAAASPRASPTLGSGPPCIPQWVSGTRLYPLVPPLPVLLESVMSGPPSFRGTPSVYRVGRRGKPMVCRLSLPAAGRLPELARRRSTTTTCRPRARAPGTSRPGDRQGVSGRGPSRVEASTVPGTHGDPFVTVEIALAEPAVVMRASVLEPEQVAAAVVDADRELGRQRRCRTVPGRKLVERADSISVIPSRRGCRRSTFPIPPARGCPSPCGSRP